MKWLNHNESSSRDCDGWQRFRSRLPELFISHFGHHRIILLHLLFLLLLLCNLSQPPHHPPLVVSPSWKLLVPSILYSRSSCFHQREPRERERARTLFRETEREGETNNGDGPPLVDVVIDLSLCCCVRRNDNLLLFGGE